MKKYGFIYIWYDRKHKKYYVGRHWGTENDGYVCSSNSMRLAYRRRSQDFKRRIIRRVYSKEELIMEEQKWLNLISKEEFGKKYYNKTPKSTSPSMLGKKHSEESKRKISEANKGNPGRKGVPQTKEWKDWFSLNHPKPLLGKKHSKETKQKMSEAQRGKKKSIEHVLKSANSRRGQKRTEESKQKMSLAQKGKKKPWVKGRISIRDMDAFRKTMREVSLIREQKKRENIQLNSSLN